MPFAIWQSQSQVGHAGSTSHVIHIVFTLSCQTHHSIGWYTRPYLTIYISCYATAPETRLYARAGQGFGTLGDSREPRAVGARGLQPAETKRASCRQWIISGAQLGFGWGGCALTAIKHCMRIKVYTCTGGAKILKRGFPPTATDKTGGKGRSLPITYASTSVRASYVPPRAKCAHIHDVCQISL